MKNWTTSDKEYYVTNIFKLVCIVVLAIIFWVIEG